MNAFNYTEKNVLANVYLRFKQFTERTTKMNELQKMIF